MSEEARLWREIGTRLDRLEERDGETSFWLRDDDAVRPGLALDRLLSIAEGEGVPLSLAVIPACAEPALAEALAPRAGVAVLQHGYSHADHAPPGEKKTELGDHRPVEAVLAELALGQERLRDFPHRAPILVPPWNRIGPGVAAGLPGLGFRGLSLYGGSRQNPAVPGLRRVDTHLDLVDWKGGKGFRGRAEGLAVLAERLRRLLDGTEHDRGPTGILTHHLVHGGDAFDFLGDLVSYLAKRRRCRFLSAAELLACEAGRKAKMGE